MKALFLLLILTAHSFSAAGARQWQKIEIPGAFCGTGQPYSIYLDQRDSAKLVIEFMSGGVCWNDLSCYGQTALTRLEPLPGNPPSDLISEDHTANPWFEHSMLYLPYCTGDVFSNSHVTSYRPGVPLYHYGYQNVLLSLQYLKDRNWIDFSALTDVVVWGASAGAIGVFVHAGNVEALLPASVRKTLISDSPGLHFGRAFWWKFSAQMNKEFADNFQKAGLNYSVDDGFLAPLMGSVFSKYHDWNIAILQSTQDWVMSLVFGGISPSDHRRLVLGPQGIGQVAKAYPHVSTWIHDGPMHTFLKRRDTGELRSMEGESAWNFIVRIYTEKAR